MRFHLDHLCILVLTGTYCPLEVNKTDLISRINKKAQSLVCVKNYATAENWALIALLTSTMGYVYTAAPECLFILPSKLALSICYFRAVFT